MAVGESGLQIYLQQALHQGGLPDLAPAQSGIAEAGGSLLPGRGAIASPKPCVAISGSSYLEEEDSGPSEYLGDLGEVLDPTHPSPEAEDGILGPFYTLKS